MKTGRKSLMVVGAVVALLSSQVLAQPWGGGPGRGPRHAAGPGLGYGRQAPGPMGLGGPGGGCPLCCPLGQGLGGLRGLAWWLDLTKEQTKQIRTIHEKAQADADTAAEVVVSARDALHKAVVTGATEEQIGSAATTLGTAIGNQAALQAKTLASVKVVLTDEQRKELDKIQEKLAPPRHRGGPLAGSGFGRGWRGGPRGPNGAAGGPPWRQMQHQQ
ncbi:MAG: Spy/CpxP family protein refolding chaperone [Phycisphaerae bacterium]|nr:Spy/CpxP family protein refolding chaperone [Phycisphaerae bacterium]